MVLSNGSMIEDMHGADERKCRLGRKAAVTACWSTGVFKQNVEAGNEENDQTARRLLCAPESTDWTHPLL